MVLFKDNFLGTVCVGKGAFSAAGYGISSVPEDSKRAAGRATHCSPFSKSLQLIQKIFSQDMAALVQKGRKMKTDTIKPYFSNVSMQNNRQGSC